MALLAFFRNAVLLKIGLIPLNSTIHVLLLRIFTALDNIYKQILLRMGLQTGNFKHEYYKYK